MYDPNKFRDFDRMIAEAKRNGIGTVIIFEPQALGDTYEELVTNLDKLAEAGLSLTMVAPSERPKANPRRN